MDAKRKKKYWWIYGGTGAALLGFGVSCSIESGFLKYQGAAWPIWALAGTLSLGLIVAGVVFLIRAGILDHELREHR